MNNPPKWHWPFAGPARAERVVPSDCPAPEERGKDATGEATRSVAQPVEDWACASRPEGAKERLAPKVPLRWNSMHVLRPCRGGVIRRSFPRVALRSPGATFAPPVATFRRPCGARSPESNPAVWRAFTLIELLITIAIIALLISILAPSLRAAMSASRATKCLSNQRQLTLGWSLYANDFRDYAVPAAYWQQQFIGTGPVVYWFGADAPGASAGSGTLMPYLAAARADRSALECPEQPAGSYVPQTQNLKFSTTYGYNGYYLSPGMTPGWGDQIAFRPWRKTADIAAPSTLLVFADTLLASSSATGMPRSSAMLDPPMLYSGSSGWQTNNSPTTAFRHGLKQKASAVARADGSALAATTAPELLKRDSKGRTLGTGNFSKTPDPGYVPDWTEWKN